MASVGSGRVQQAVNGHENALVMAPVFNGAIPVAGNFVRQHPATGITVSVHQMVDTMIHAPNGLSVSPTEDAMVPSRNRHGVRSRQTCPCRGSLSRSTES